MTNKFANKEFLKIKGVMWSCKTYEQLKIVLNMIETFEKRNPTFVEERVRLRDLYKIEESKYKM